MRTIAERLAEIKRLREANQLNDKIFSDNHLIPEVRDKIKEIVDVFLEYIQVDIRVLDIRLVGSNAAYNYHDGSDLDVHIVTDLSKISDPEVIARLYFDSIKKQFKDAYDITIKGIDVELYIEDVNTSAVSNGIYSVIQDHWIKEPEVVEEPSSEVVSAAEDMASEIEASFDKAKDINEIEDVLDKLYMMRKDSLASEGENGVGNLAFKILRNNGSLDKMKQALKDVTSKELSLEGVKLK